MGRRTSKTRVLRAQLIGSERRLEDLRRSDSTDPEMIAEVEAIVSAFRVRLERLELSEQ